MTTSARTASKRRGRRDPVQVVIAGLILLGVLASIVLVFSDTIQMLRVGVVVALWAAIIGAMAMTKYRRESVVDRAKTRDLQTVYELQLEREISARREFEMGVEARVRREVGADAEELADLRAELAALRTALERLFDGELPVERVALRADARREIDAARIAVDRRAPAPVLGNGAAAVQLAGPAAVYSVGPADVPVTAEVSLVAVDMAALDQAALDQADQDVLDAETVEDLPPADLPEPAPGSRRSRRRNGNGNGTNATATKPRPVASTPPGCRSRRSWRTCAPNRVPSPLSLRGVDASERYLTSLDRGLTHTPPAILVSIVRYPHCGTGTESREDSR